jgi:uncharacterized protein
MNSPLYFELQCNDIARAKDFYEKVFGWKFQHSVSAPIEYWEITTEGIRGGLLPRPAEVFPAMSGTNAATVSMEVKSFDDTAKVIIDNGGQVAMPKFPIPGRCWQGYFIDTEANVLAFSRSTATLSRGTSLNELPSSPGVVVTS